MFFSIVIFLERRTGSVLSVERDVVWCIWTDHWTVTSCVGVLWQHVLNRMCEFCAMYLNVC